MEKIRTVSNTLEKQVAMLRLRYWGSFFLHLVSFGVIIYLVTRTNYVAIDPVGNVYTTKKVERTDRDVLLIESDAHARSFYNSFWTFTHLNRRTQLSKATSLGGNIVRELYKVLQERGYYTEIEKNNYYVASTIDSVDVKNFGFNGQSVYLKVYGHMVLENNRFSELRDLDMELRMVLVERIREKNPNGLSIEDIKILSNETISVKEKK